MSAKKRQKEPVMIRETESGSPARQCEFVGGARESVPTCVLSPLRYTWNRVRRAERRRIRCIAINPRLRDANRGRGAAEKGPKSQGD